MMRCSLQKTANHLTSDRVSVATIAGSVMELQMRITAYQRRNFAPKLRWSYAQLLLGTPRLSTESARLTER